MDKFVYSFTITHYHVVPRRSYLTLSEWIALFPESLRIETLHHTQANCQRYARPLNQTLSESNKFRLGLRSGVRPVVCETQQTGLVRYRQSQELKKNRQAWFPHRCISDPSSWMAFIQAKERANIHPDGSFSSRMREKLRTCWVIDYKNDNKPFGIWITSHLEWPKAVVSSEEGRQGWKQTET